MALPHLHKPMSYPLPGPILPPFDLEVIATTVNGDELFAVYLDSGIWVKGVDNNPINEEIQQLIVAWRFCGEDN